MAALTMVRVPGSKVPTLRCQGHLTLDTGESLRREIALSSYNGSPGVVVNIDRLSELDGDGALVLSELAGQSVQRGKQLVLVAGTPSARALLARVGIDPQICIYENETLAHDELLA